MTNSSLQNRGVPSSAVFAKFVTVTVPFSLLVAVTLYCGAPATVTSTVTVCKDSCSGRTTMSVPDRSSVPFTVKLCSRFDACSYVSGISHITGILVNIELSLAVRIRTVFGRLSSRFAPFGRFRAEGLSLRSSVFIRISLIYAVLLLPASMITISCFMPSSMSAFIV